MPTNLVYAAPPPPPDFQTFRHPCQVLDTRGYKVQKIREFDLDQTVRFQLERVGDGTFLYIEELEEYRQNFTLYSNKEKTDDLFVQQK